MCICFIYFIDILFIFTFCGPNETYMLLSLLNVMCLPRPLHRDHTGKIVLHLCGALLLLNCMFLVASELPLAGASCVAIGAAVSSKYC